MQVEVQLFSFLRDCLPKGAERGRMTVELKAGNTVKDLFDLLQIDRCMPDGRHLANELHSWQVSVNGEFLSDLSRELKPGDQVLVFPHMAGG